MPPVRIGGLQNLMRWGTRTIRWFVLGVLRAAGMFATSPLFMSWCGAFLGIGRRRARTSGSPQVPSRGSIVIIRLDRLGDAVLTSPLLREVRKQYPQCHITLVVRTWLLPLFVACPYVDQMVGFEALPRRVAPWRWFTRAYKMAKRMSRQRRYDMALCPRWDVDFAEAALVAYLVGAHYRIGVSETVNDAKTVLDRGVDRLWTHSIADVSARHEVERSLDVARVLGVVAEDRKLECWTTANDQRIAKELIAGLQGPMFRVALGIGASHPMKYWPIERFAEIGSYLLKQYNAGLVVIGDESSLDDAGVLTERLSDSRHGLPVVNLVGRTSLGELTAVLQECDMYIGNDSGPMHLAAAAGSAIVELSAHPATGDPGNALSPSRFGPWGVANRVVQPEACLPPCVETCNMHVAHCICGISVDMVKRAIDELHGELSGRR